MALDCSTNLANTGMSQCSENIGRYFKFITVPDNFEIADIATAMIETNWTDYFQADKSGRAYVFPEIVKNNSITQNEPVFEALIAGQTDYVREGTDVLDFGLETMAVCVFAKLRTHNRRKPKVVIIDSEGNILAYSPDGTKIQGIDTNVFYVKKMTINDGEMLTRAGLYVEIKNPEQMNDNLKVITPTAFDPTKWDGLHDTTLTEVTQSTTSITISAKDECDNSAIIGLVEADFLVTDSGGSAVTITTFTDNEDGTYTFDATFTAGDFTFTLAAPKDMTTLGYESAGAITITTS